MDRDADQAADDGAVDPDELQVAADVQLDPLRRLLAVPALDRVGDDGSELTAVITQTIERWDGKEAARKIELHVGRDLQFIRINGTIVGGLVGLVIHAVTVVVR